MNFGKKKFRPERDIISEVRSDRNYLHLIPNIDKIILQTIKYNEGRKNNYIGNTMLTAYNMIENPENITAESDYQAFVIAWAAQMTDSYNNIISKARNGDGEKSKQNFFEVSVSTAKYADLLRSFMYAMIEQKFQDTKWYRDFLQLYNKAFLYGAIGQYLENSSEKQTNTNAKITADKYEHLCEYTVSYPYFQLPLFLAMTLSNKTNKDLLHNVGRVCSDIGMLYQIQEDFENCFGTEAIGTDIQKGKCTWLAVTALQRFTPRQLVVFKACYGSNEPAHVERVKLLYEQLQLPRLFREKEGALYETIMQQAESLEENGIPPRLFEKLLNAIRN